MLCVHLFHQRDGDERASHCTESLSSRSSVESAVTRLYDVIIPVKVYTVVLLRTLWVCLRLLVVGFLYLKEP